MPLENRAHRLEWDLNSLIAPVGPPVRRIELMTPVSITRSPSGRTLLDFGQNLVGRLRLSVQGPAGQTITLRHAEVLENGELCTRPLRNAEATDRYTLRGGGVETWEPRFTFHGFRYAEVDGWPGELHPADICAVVIHSDMERTGWFECSDPLLNRLHANVVWSMRGNFVDIPTDCPQRDERLGWTGDLQVFSPTASFLYDVSGFLASWLADLAVEQAKAGGSVPPFIPNSAGRGIQAAAAWADAATVVPWVLYERFGDRAILATQFESMRAWVDYVDSVAGEKRLWERGFQFGDWLDPTAPPDKPGQARTDKAIIATPILPIRQNWLARRRTCSGRELKRSPLSQPWPAKYVQAFARRIRHASRTHGQRCRNGLCLGTGFRSAPHPRTAPVCRGAPGELVREGGYTIRHRFCGHTPDLRCAVQKRALS